MKKEQFIKEYSKKMLDGDAAIFAGAGLSLDAGFINWHDLVKPFATDIGLNPDRENDLTLVAQYYFNKNRSRDKINEQIMNSFNANIIPENINILSRLPIHTFWTTNYDSLLEKGLENNHKLIDVKVSEKSLNISKTHRDAVIYKMHGDANNPSETVFIKDDYESYANKHGLFRTFLKTDLLSKTFLFIGFSFDDPNLQYILAQIRLSFLENAKTHYCFFKETEKISTESDDDFKYRQVKQRLKINDLARYGIKAVILNDYSEITEILKSLESIFLQNKIFISGSIEKYNNDWSKEKVDDFSYLLSKYLVSENYTVISGFGLGIGTPVINGALKEIFEHKNGRVDDFLKLYPFPQSTTEEKQWFSYRKNIINNTGICIFIFGNKISNKSAKVIDAPGVIEEFNIAKKYNRIIIPIGNTGWASKTIWNEIKKDIDNYPYLKDYIDSLTSTHETEEIIKLISKIISESKED